MPTPAQVADIGCRVRVLTADIHYLAQIACEYAAAGDRRETSVANTKNYLAWHSLWPVLKRLEGGK
jgi:hypothetical protein